ncbi:MAG: NF038122 family metalloprotease [Rhodopila sp.]|nr:NF038122 family metalloprotease [Rhodopila sp.]
MQINFVYDSSVQGAPTGFKQGLIAAADIIDSAILNPITITIGIGYGEDNGSTLSAGTLAEAQPAFGVLLTYNQLVGSLSAAATSADDTTFVNSLPATDPSNGANFFVSAAQAIAWGMIDDTSNQIDGYAGFSSSLPFDYDPSDGITPGTYDFVGVALHELTHALGRYLTSSWLTPMNLLGYGSNGQIDLVNTDPRYLSFDGGKTNLGNLDTKSDAADFASGGPVDPFDAAVPSGTALPWSALDSRLMDVLGYTMAAPAAVQIPNFAVMDTTTRLTSTSNGTVYTGPVAGLDYQFISATTDSVVITANVSNVFIASGAGTDALSVANVGGRNVLDGGAGSNFLVGSTNAASQDTFFVDDRSATADIWSTMVNVHAGDDVTVWGLTANDFTLAWADGQGAAGFTGLTLHATAAGKPAASLTLPGFASADLSNGRLGVSFGTVDGNTYLHIAVQA